MHWTESGLSRTKFRINQSKWTKVQIHIKIMCNNFLLEIAIKVKFYICEPHGGRDLQKIIWTAAVGEEHIMENSRAKCKLRITITYLDH